MTIKNCLRFTLPFVALFAFASIASAQATATLTMTALVQDTMQLKISTHATGATVTPVTVDTAANAFSVAFGNVNGLGIGSRSANVEVVADSNGALYTTPIYVTPIFSGFDTDYVAAVTVKSGGGTNNALAGEGSAADNTAVLTSTPGAAFSGAASESQNTRFVSFNIARTRIAGALTASFIYEMTVSDPTP